MTEADLIKKIQELKQIKPRKDWVILTKSQILGQEPKMGWASILEVFPRFLFQPKPAFATLIILGALVGTFGLAQNSLPGDFMYSLKRVAEKGQAVFVSEIEKPKAQLELVNKRLEELTKIAETNRVKNIAPALEEYQASASQAAKEITKAKQPDVKEIVQQTKKLEENKQKIEALGIVVGETEELDNAVVQLAEREIKDLENRILTEKQEELLTEAKQDFETGNFASALEKILLLSYPQEK